jgi:hypothetical protein
MFIHSTCEFSFGKTSNILHLLIVKTYELGLARYIEAEVIISFGHLCVSLSPCCPAMSAFYWWWGVNCHVVPALLMCIFVLSLIGSKVQQIRSWAASTKRKLLAYLFGHNDTFIYLVNKYCKGYMPGTILNPEEEQNSCCNQGFHLLKDYPRPHAMPMPWSRW